MFSQIKHLLPNGRAWRATVDKTLRRFLLGLGAGLSPFRENFDNVADDLYPQTTRLLDEYEEQFGLYPSALSSQERRDRISAAWSGRGGQSPSYIQKTLRAAGFNVYVHDWWYSTGSPSSAEVGTSELGTSELWTGGGGETVRNPFDVLGDSATLSVVTGNANAITGNANAVTGAVGSPTGYLLVNRPEENTPLIPTDSSLWPLIMYIGGQVWGEKASIPSARQNEFEALCLKICPAHLWIGLIVEYS